MYIFAGGAPGSGKTTLIRRLIRQAASRAVATAAVICDVARDGFDAGLLGDEVATVVTSPGPASLQELFITIERLGDRAPLVVVELPASMPPALAASRFANAPRMKDSGRPVVPVGIMDAQFLRDESATFVRGAPVVLVNKMDTCPDDTAPGMLARLRGELRDSTVIPTVESTVTLDELNRAPKLLLDSHDPQPAPAVEYQYFTFPITAPLSRETAMWITSDPPRSTLRARGCVQIEGEPGYSIVQVTGRSGSLRRYHAEPPGRSLTFVAGPGVPGELYLSDLRVRLNFI